MVESTMELLSLRASPEVRGILEDLRPRTCQDLLTGGAAGGACAPLQRSAAQELQRLHREETAHLLGTLACEAVMERWGVPLCANGPGGPAGATSRGSRPARAAALLAAGGEESQLLDRARRPGGVSPQELALAAARLVPAPVHHLNAASADFQDGDLAAARAVAAELLLRPLPPRVRAGCLRLLALVERGRGRWDEALRHSCAAMACLPDDLHGRIAALQAAVRADAADEALRICAQLAPRAAEVAACGPHLGARPVGAGNERLSGAEAGATRRRLAGLHGDWTEVMFRVA